MALSFEEMNILGNLVNDTYGKPSTQTGYGDSRLGGYSMGGTGTANSVVTKSSFDGNVMHVTSLAIINLGPIGMQHQEIAKCENELNQHIKGYVSDLKKRFKKKENAGRTLKAKLVKDSEKTGIEMINHYAATRRAYVRRTICFEIG
tara:strand:+ start:231 stop:671 length:441 start_codon:yes stop_codon:yes gene_type:complete